MEVWPSVCGGEEHDLMNGMGMHGNTKSGIFGSRKMTSGSGGNPNISRPTLGFTRMIGTTVVDPRESVVVVNSLDKIRGSVMTTVEKPAGAVEMVPVMMSVPQTPVGDEVGSIKVRVIPSVVTVVG